MKSNQPREPHSSASHKAYPRDYEEHWPEHQSANRPYQNRQTLTQPHKKGKKKKKSRGFCMSPTLSTD